MKALYSVALFTALVGNSISTLAAPLRDTFSGPYLEVFIVEPPNPIKWKTPGKLLKSSLKNAISKDYAPNGHYIVHFSSDVPNRHGVRSVLTGVSRASAKESIRITREENLGMSAMLYTFEGNLDNARSDVSELATAKSQGRLSSLLFKLSPESANQIMTFLDNYISYGSYKNYGGMKNTLAGEGSGCADFAYAMIQLATSGRIPDSEWKTSVYLPKKLMKIVPGRADDPVSFGKILLNGGSWGTSPADGVLFTTPDPDKMTAWIGKQSATQNKQLIYNSEDQYSSKNLPSFVKEGKSMISRDSAAAMWKRISNFKESELPQ